MFLLSPPRLITRRPSPTTIEFTVTTSPPSSTTLTILRFLLLSARLLTLSTITILTLLRLAPSIASSAPPILLTLFTSILAFAPSPAHYFYPLALLAGYAALQRVSTQESLLVIAELGIQTATTAGTLWGQKPKTRFIEQGRARDLWLMEGFWGWQVRYYVAVSVEGEGGLVVVFPTLLPGRETLEVVWRGARSCLN